MLNKNPVSSQNRYITYSLSRDWRGDIILKEMKENGNFHVSSIHCVHRTERRFNS